MIACPGTGKGVAVDGHDPVAVIDFPAGGGENLKGIIVNVGCGAEGRPAIEDLPPEHQGNGGAEHPASLDDQPRRNGAAFFERAKRGERSVRREPVDRMEAEGVCRIAPQDIRLKLEFMGIAPIIVAFAQSDQLPPPEGVDIFLDQIVIPLFVLRLHHRAHDARRARGVIPDDIRR